jgi:proton glutamate symport protein
MPRLALHWQIALGMALGAALGVSLNLLAGSTTTRLQDGLPSGMAEVEVIDAVGRVRIRIVSEDGSEQSFSAESREALERKRPELAEPLARAPACGANLWGRRFGRLGGLFLRLLRMVALPLVITSLGAGILGLGNAASIGRLFGRTLTYYLATSLLAILTGIAMVNLVRPGLGSAAGDPALAADRSAHAAADTTDTGGVASLADVLFSQIESLVPENPFTALVEPNFLSVIAFTLGFSLFALRVGGPIAARVRSAFEAGFEVMMAMTHAIIRLAPLGVLFLVAATTATQGASVFASLSAYMLTVALALALHACLTLPLILRFVARRNPWSFAKAMAPALLTAFSSASSNGTLPLTLDCVEKRAGIRNRVGSFVLPLGATVNMDGTALYEAVAVLFIAQLHFGHDLPLAQQAVVCLTALLASVGAAGIPHAGLVMMAIILQAVGLPADSQGIILAVDRVLDMARTTVNVWSDSCGAAVLDALEGPASAEDADLQEGHEPEPAPSSGGGPAGQGG